MRWFSVLALLAFLLPLACPAGDLQVFDNAYNWTHPERVNVGEQDMLFNDPYQEDYQSRIFSYVGCLEDDTLFSISLFRWRYACFQGWGLSAMVTDSSGKTYVYEQKIRNNQVSLATDRFDVRCEECTLSGANGVYRVRVDLEQFGCDLRLTNILPAWKPGDGAVYIQPRGKRIMRFSVPSPLARVEGELRTGEHRRPVSGLCYADRTLHTLPPTRWYAPISCFRGYYTPDAPADQRWFISVLRYQTNLSIGPQPVAMLLLARGDRWIMTSKDFTFRYLDPESEPGIPHPCPRRVAVTAAANGYNLEGAFVASRVFHISDIFAKLPEFLRAIASLFFSRPVVFRMRGRFEGTITAPDGSQQEIFLHGIYEHFVTE